MPALKLFVASLLAMATTVVSAQEKVAIGLTTDISLLAAATPDECFEGIGQNTLGVAPPCEGDAISKVNEAYVWGMALANDKVFFGTVTNTQCLVIGTFLGSTNAFENESGQYVCEFGESPMLQAFPTLPPALGDFRPPSLYMYDFSSESLTELSTRMPGPDQQRLASTLGIRAAGAHNGVVFFAGISLISGGINLFAFSDEGVFVESANLSEYFNIRNFRVIGDELYAGLGFSDPENGQLGHVLRWIGTSSKPIEFEIVGEVDSEVAELAEHDGRVFVTTWPDNTSDSRVEAALYMSPELGEDGRLSTNDENGWQKVFTVSDYEPSPISAAVYGLGALASFDGYLFWGTMHVPGTGVLAHTQALAEGLSLSEEDSLQAERSISIFRGRYFTDPSGPEIDVLYGYEGMSVLNPETGEWAVAGNKLGMDPLFGAPGFNNPLNNYTWTMAVYDNRLWVGTMNVSGLIAQASTLSNNEALSSIEQALINFAATNLIGANLWFFVSSDLPAIPETLNGAGNPANYGFRTMATDGDQLIIGTANPTNLLTDQTSRSQGIGGWELLSLEARSFNTLAGDDVTVEAGNGISVNFCSVTTDGYTVVLDSSFTPATESLLVAINESLQEAAPSDIVIENAYVFLSNADFGTDGECSVRPVTLSLEFDEPLYEPRLLLVNLDVETEELLTEDITSSTTAFGGHDYSAGFSTGLAADLPPFFGATSILISSPGPELSVSPSLDVSEVEVGQTSDGQTVTVTNSGGAPLILGELSLGGTDAAEFEVLSDECSSETLPVGESCVVEVSLTPLAVGSRTAAFVIPSNALTSPNSVVLSGTGIQAALSVDDSVDLGSVIVDEASAGEAITLTNSGTAPLILGELSLSGPDAAEFVVLEDGCSGRILSIGESCRIIVRVEASRPGKLIAELNVPSNASGGSRLVLLFGEASPPPLPVFSLNAWWLMILGGLLGFFGLRGLRH